MWERWNATTKIFEKSSNNGASWTPLGLDASIITQGTIDPARLPSVANPNIAYTNVANTFTERQTFSKDLHAIELKGTTHAGLILTDTSQPVDQRKFRIIHYLGDLRFQTMNDAESAAPTSPLMLHAAGGMSTGSWIISTGFHYPGRVDTGAAQSAWYLGSHASYGLYSNTGLYLAGNLTVASAGNSMVGCTFTGNVINWLGGTINLPTAGVNNNVALPNDFPLFHVTTGAGVQIGGLTPRGVGSIIILINTGANSFNTIANQAGSTVGWRFARTSGNVNPGQVLTIVYAGNAWYPSL